MADAGEIGLAVSEPIIEEVMRVLHEKFHWSSDALAEARFQMEGIARKVTPAEAVTWSGVIQRTTVFWSAWWLPDRITSSLETMTYCE
jgi:hypothetical protein